MSWFRPSFQSTRLPIRPAPCKLIRGNVECTSCHNPHVQAKDPISLNFLVRDSSSGQMCLACHDPTRTISGQVNPLGLATAQWSTSIHATATNKVTMQASVGSYSTVALNACISCHAPHEAGGPSRLLRGAERTGLYLPAIAVVRICLPPLSTSTPSSARSGILSRLAPTRMMRTKVFRYHWGASNRASQQQPSRHLRGLP